VGDCFEADICWGVFEDLLGVAGIEVECGPWTRPRISEKMLAKAARSLPNACGALGLDAVPGASKEGPRFVGSNESVFGS
jgi:hypothetical protein